MAGTLFTYADNFRAFKILIAAQFSGAQVKVAGPPEFKFGETNKTPEFQAKFPLGKVPAFETADGQTIFESNAIAYYVANEQLRGCSALDQAKVQQFINFADNEILPAACTWVYPTLGIMQYNKQNTEKAMDQVRTVLKFLNEHLLARTYLVGERVTLADISVACALLGLYKQILEPAFRGPYANVNRWFTTIVNQPQAKAVLGEVALCETMAKFDAKKFAEMQPKKEKKPKEAKPEKKKEEPKPKAAEPEAEEEEPKPKPKKDVFGHLPKSDFDFDAFKRCYSNEDTLTKAIPYFWEHIDLEGYSIWHMEYQYNDELTLTFMSSNLIGGLLQRLEGLNKNAFASLCVLGENHNNSISGIWVWRGQELVFPLNPNWQTDYHTYNFRKLDPAAEETKTLVREYFSWEFADKKFSCGKIFK